MKQKNYFVVTILAIASYLSIGVMECKAGAQELSTSNFSSTINSTDLPVVVDFWAPWCGPCLELAPTIEELANQTKGQAIIAKVNIDENPQLAQQYGIQGIPTILFFRNGKVENQVRGVQSLDTLKSALGSTTSAGLNSLDPESLSKRGKSMLDRLAEATSN
jgi:thioredoxin 1